MNITDNRFQTTKKWKGRKKTDRGRGLKGAGGPGVRGWGLLFSISVRLACKKSEKKWFFSGTEIDFFGD
jgi:hypothetical protein